MTTTQISMLATATSLLATVALSYFGIPAHVNCSVASVVHTVAYASVMP